MGERKIEKETGAGERKRETGMRERKIERQEREKERQGWEREGGRKRRSDRGEREKIANIKKFMEFYLVVLQSIVVLQSGYRSIVHFLVKALKLVQR